MVIRNKREIRIHFKFKFQFNGEIIEKNGLILIQTAFMKQLKNLL